MYVFETPKLKEQQKEKRDGLVEGREKTIKPPPTFKPYIFFRDSERTHKDFKLQNANCSFEPTSNIVPFASKRHILFIP
jgi:hypothetical protein